MAVDEHGRVVSDNSADPSRHDRLSGCGSGPIRQGDGCGFSETLSNSDSRVAIGCHHVLRIASDSPIQAGIRIGQARTLT